jgi:hypothetical protein
MSASHGGLLRRVSTWIAHRTVKGTDGLTRAQRDALARGYLTEDGGPVLDAEQLEQLHQIARKGGPRHARR